MPLIDGHLLLQRFTELVNQAKQIGIAVAWARSCDAVEELAASDADVRIVVGISGNVYRPVDTPAPGRFLRSCGLLPISHPVPFIQNITAFMVKKPSAGSAAQT